MTHDSFPESAFFDQTVRIINAIESGKDEEANRLMESIVRDYSSFGPVAPSAHPAVYALTNCAKKIGMFTHFFDFFQKTTFREEWDVAVRLDINNLLPLVSSGNKSPDTIEKFNRLVGRHLSRNVIFPLSEDVMHAMATMAYQLGQAHLLHCIDRAHFYSKCLDPDHSPHRRPGGFFEIAGQNLPNYTPARRITPQLLYDDLVMRCPRRDDCGWYIEMLVDYAKECQTITELGVFQGVSTSGFLSVRPTRYRGYDLDFSRFDVELYLDMAADNAIDASFIHGSSHDVEIEPVDFLFIDTVHTYEHVREEIRKHHHKVSKYIAIHDTNYPKPPRPGKKVREAAEELVSTVSHWMIVEHIKQHTGMIILKRT